MNSYFKYRDIIQTCDPRVWSSIKKSRESSQTPSLYWKSLLWFGKGKSSEIQLIQLPSPYSPHHHTTGWGIKFAAQQFEFNTLLTIYQSLLLSSLSSWAKEWQRACILSIASMLKVWQISGILHALQLTEATLSERLRKILLLKLNLFCSLLQERSKRGLDEDIAISRVEQVHKYQYLFQPMITRLPCLALPFFKEAMKETGDGYSTVLASPCSEVQVFLACPHE